MLPILILISSGFVFAECIDSDGGKDYFNKGRVEIPLENGESKVKEDYCYGKDVVEYYCWDTTLLNDTDYIMERTYSCTEDCLNGACTKGKVPYCDFIGTSEEGWYRNGSLLKKASCEDQELKCLNKDTSEEGWYYGENNILISTRDCCLPRWYPLNWGNCSANGGVQYRDSYDENHCFGMKSERRQCCQESWVCGNWTYGCHTGKQNRTCTKTDNCINNPPYKPDTVRQCRICFEEWECTEWSKCSDTGVQTRICKDSHNCNTNINKPHIKQNCGKKLNVTENSEDNSEKIEEVTEEPIISEEDAKSKAVFFDSISSIELKKIEDKNVYFIRGEIKGKLLFIIPVTAQIESQVDSKTGEVLSTKKPWWAFLASGI